MTLLEAIDARHSVRVYKTDWLRQESQDHFRKRIRDMAAIIRKAAKEDIPALPVENMPWQGI